MCLADGESTTSQSVVAHNRLSVNRLAVNRLAVNRLAVNRLAVNRLAVNRLAANLETMGDLLATPEGQDLLGYIVSCALPEGTVLAPGHLAVKKPGGGIPASRMSQLIGGRLRRAVKADEPLRFEDL